MDCDLCFLILFMKSFSILSHKISSKCCSFSLEVKSLSRINFIVWFEIEIQFHFFFSCRNPILTFYLKSQFFFSYWSTKLSYINHVSMDAWVCLWAVSSGPVVTFSILCLKYQSFIIVFGIYYCPVLYFFNYDYLGPFTFLCDHNLSKLILFMIILLCTSMFFIEFGECLAIISSDI